METDGWGILSLHGKKHVDKTNVECRMIKHQRKDECYLENMDKDNIL